jgi:hypothetical protein
MPTDISTLLYSEPQTRRYVSGGRLHQRPLHTFTTPVARPQSLGPEHSPYYFNPGRVDRLLAPEDFRRKLHELDPRLEACWHPVLERWQIWFHSPSEVTNPRMKGWKLIFRVEYPDGSYMPLDERTLAKAWDRSGRKWGSMSRYWDRVESEFWRASHRAHLEHKQIVRDIAGDRYDFAQIKVSMRGKSSGSKFANHHAGD